MANTRFAFQVAGIAPRDPSFRIAGDAEKQAFWGAAVAWVREAWTVQMAAGKGADGEDLAEIAASTRKRGRWRSYTGMGSANAPPLTPAYGLSRTRALFDARAHWREGYVLGFWRADPISGRHWGQVLGWHRDGAGRLPERDVIGLAPAGVAQVQAQADAWWAERRADRAGLAAGRTTLALGANRPMPARPKPAPVTIDLRHATFGIGATEDLIQKAAVQGKLSAPRRAGGAPAPAETQAGIERELGVRFTPDLFARGRMTTVVIDVQKLNVELAKDTGHHVGPRGSGAAKPGSYAGFQEFLEKARREGIAIEMPRVVIADRTGTASIDNGRHRFAVLRDLGVTALPVSVPRGQAAMFRRMFGAR